MYPLSSRIYVREAQIGSRTRGTVMSANAANISEWRGGGPGSVVSTLPSELTASGWGTH